jgi:hypothetical protein
MTRSNEQTYIQRLGFQDKDRQSSRHALACEYLLHRIIETSVTENSLAWRITREVKDLTEELEKTYDPRKKESLEQELKAIEKYDLGTFDHEREIAQLLDRVNPSEYIDVPIPGGYQGQYVNGFADVYAPKAWVDLGYDESTQEIKPRYRLRNRSVLGEVKITPEPASSVNQQISFYRKYLYDPDVVILLDYPDPELARMYRNSGDTKVAVLGQKFEEWVKSRSMTEISEL